MAGISWETLYSGLLARDANMEVSRLRCKTCDGFQEGCICEAEGEEITMSNGSNGVEFPELDVTHADREKGMEYRFKGRCADVHEMEPHAAVAIESNKLMCRERQLRDALDQIATLTAQVADLQANNTHEIIRGVALRYQERYEKAEDELAALRKGFITTFEVDWSYATSPNLENCMVFHSEYDLRRWIRLQGWRILVKECKEVITRERILDDTVGEDDASEVGRV